MIALITGGVLLSFEVLTTRMIGPYFGHSIYVWASVIGTTMLGLATGYLISEYITSKSNNVIRILFVMLAGLGVYILLLPWFAAWLMGMMVSMDVLKGILLATILFNYPLFVMFGLFSPLLIFLASSNQLSSESKNHGIHAGLIYGLSTLGGVICLLVTAWYLLPGFGLTTSVVLMGVIILITGFAFFLLAKSEILRRKISNE